MFARKTILRAAGASLAAILSLAAQPARAQGSDAERLQKLEQAVGQLQKRNAELEQEVSGLKKRTAWEPVAGAEGKDKTEVTSDGKTYVEKFVPQLASAEKWKLFPAITELELFGDLRLRYEYRGGRLPDHFQLGQNNSNDWQERERERYRLRIGLRGTLLDDWFFGVRLETSANARSTNVTLGGDTSPTSPGGGGPFAKGDDGIFVGQAYGGYKGFPGFTFTSGRMPNPFGNTFNVHFSGDPGGNQTGINSLLVFDIPAEIGWKVGKIPMRIFGDFATNLEADDRATAAGHPDKDGQRYAYQAGLGIGQLKKKHDWQIEGYWQHQEQFSLDPNLIDSDLFNSQLNQQGAVLRAGYMLADAVVFDLTYSYAWRINGRLGTGGVGDITINPLDQ